MSRTVRRSPRQKPPAANWGLVGPSEAAVQRLSEQQVDLPDRPADRAPRLPQDPTGLGDSELMTLFVEMTEWAAYTGTLLAIAEVNESSADAEVKRLEALSAAANAGAKSVTAAKAMVYEDPDFVAAKAAQEEARAYRKISSHLHEVADKRSTVLSRELTRRVGREPRENRAAGRFGT